MKVITYAIIVCVLMFWLGTYRYYPSKMKPTKVIKEKVYKVFSGVFAFGFMMMFGSQYAIDFMVWLDDVILAPGDSPVWSVFFALFIMSILAFAIGVVLYYASVIAGNLKKWALTPDDADDENP